MSSNRPPASTLVRLLLLGLLGACDIVAPVLDSTPPRMVLVVPQDTVWPDSVLPVAGRAIDDHRVTRVTYRVDGGEEHEFQIHPARYVEFSDGVSLSGNGTTAVVITAYDEGRNHVSESLSFRTDTKGPSIELDLPDSVLARDTLMVRAVIRDPSRISRVTVRYRNRSRDVVVPADTMVSMATPQPLRAGVWNLSLEAVDGVGNVTSSPSVTVLADQVAPRIWLYAPMLAAGDSARVVAVAQDQIDVGIPGHLNRVVAVRPDDTETVLWTGAGATAVVDRLRAVPADSGRWTIAAYDSVGNRAVVSTPTRTIAHATEVAATDWYACVLDGTGQGWCWGDGAFGELGSGSRTTSANPVPIAGGHVFRRIATGKTHACALDDGGAAWCWGSNWAGALGDGTNDQASTPVAVAGGLTLTALAAGDDHTCALDNDGLAWCWGLNTSGQLGTGDTVSSSVPVSGTSRAYRSIAATGLYTCGIGVDGNAYCWGSYPGSATPSVTPVALTTQGHLTRVQVGWDRACALDDAGAAWCWGRDITTGEERTVPAQLAELGSVTEGTANQTPPPATPLPALQGMPFEAIATGGGYTCGIDTLGSVYCWGNQ
ncbi:MAG: hypothetical protein P8Z36_17195 [Gemmatimonadota bacterium]